MAKKSAANHMNHTERVAGGLFFLVYLLVLPLLVNKVFDFIGVLLGTEIGESLANILYYYTIFAVTVLLFHSYIGKMTSRLLGGLNRSIGTYFAGLLGFYGANELFYRLSHVIFGSHTNLNDMTIAAQINSAPRMTALIVIFLAPFIEEVLFRGLVFGTIREKSRPVAYVISCALFAFLHVWTFALSNWDLGYFVLMLQYLVPGIVFAWVYEYSTTIWTAIALHATVNALSLWTIVG